MKWCGGGGEVSHERSGLGNLRAGHFILACFLKWAVFGYFPACVADASQVGRLAVTCLPSAELRRGRQESIIEKINKLTCILVTSSVDLDYIKSDEIFCCSCLFFYD